MFKKSLCILSAVLCIGLLAGCGVVSGGASAINELGADASVKSDDNWYRSDSYDYSEDYDSYSDYESTVGVNSEADIVKSTMMIAKDVDVSCDVANLDDFDVTVKNRVDKYGGYFEESNIDNYDSEWATRRYARYGIRIPADKLDAFLNDIDGTSSITSKSVRSEDVSLDYVDNEAHITALEQERENLSRLLDETKDVSEVLEIEDRLSDVQARLDSYNGQKRLLEGRVSYSRVNLSACEERNVDHPIRRAFSVNLKEQILDSIETTVKVTLTLVTGIPLVLIICFFIVFVLWFIRLIWRKVFRVNKRVRYMLMPVAMDDSLDQSCKKCKDSKTKVAVDIDETKADSSVGKLMNEVEQTNSNIKVNEE